MGGTFPNMNFIIVFVVYQWYMLKKALLTAGRTEYLLDVAYKLGAVGFVQ